MVRAQVQTSILMTKRIKYLMAEWSGEYISPYAEHGKKSEQVKKITVSIPLKVLKILTDERTRRQVNNLRHAPTASCCVKHFCTPLPGNPCRMMPICEKSAAMKSRKRQKRSCVRWGLIRKRGNTDSKACGQNASGRAFLTIPLVHGYLRHCSKCSSSRIALGG
ncbi:transcriptional repressor protein MetJ [Salmonella enterica subsp. enterica]|uniref:Met repressor n=1 Tax=Salmonella enterica I TaxID=59201 RepID=A0A379UYD4_SALET|nr:transcriptional repressor protein MetJ [Salmonella enterica subsp. enterica]